MSNAPPVAEYLDAIQLYDNGEQLVTINVAPFLRGTDTVDATATQWIFDSSKITVDSAAVNPDGTQIQAMFRRPKGGESHDVCAHVVTTQGEKKNYFIKVGGLINPLPVPS